MHYYPAKCIQNNEKKFQKAPFMLMERSRQKISLPSKSLVRCRSWFSALCTMISVKKTWQKQSGFEQICFHNLLFFGWNCDFYITIGDGYGLDLRLIRRCSFEKNLDFCNDTYCLQNSIPYTTMRWGTFHYSSTTQLLLRSEKSFLQVVWRSVPKILDMSLISQMQLEYVGKSFLQMSTTTIAMNNFLDCRLNCNILHLNCLSIGKYQVRIFKRTLKVRFCRNNQFKVDWILNKEV